MVRGSHKDLLAVDSNNNVLNTVNEIEVGKGGRRELKVNLELLRAKYTLPEMISGILRFESGVWTILQDDDDLNHTPLHVVGIEGTDAAPEVWYSGFPRTGHVSIVPDETYAKEGVIAGTSVSGNRSIVEMSKHTQRSGRINYTGSVWQITLNQGDATHQLSTAVWNTNELDLVWDELTDATVMVTSNAVGCIAIVDQTSITSTGCSIQFYNLSDESQKTTEDTEMDFTIIVCYSNVITSQAQLEDTPIASSANFWVSGAMQNQFQKTLADGDFICNLDFPYSFTDSSGEIYDKVNGINAHFTSAVSGGETPTWATTDGENYISLIPANEEMLVITKASPFFQIQQTISYYVRFKTDQINPAAALDLLGYWNSTVANERGIVLLLSTGTATMSLTVSDDGTATTNASSLTNVNTTDLWDVIVTVEPTQISIKVGKKGEDFETSVTTAYTAPTGKPHYDGTGNSRRPSSLFMGIREFEPGQSTYWDGGIARFASKLGLFTDSEERNLRK